MPPIQLQPAPYAPFQPGWYSFDLGRYRPCDGTYCFYPYESLPPIQDVGEALGWLGPLDERTVRVMEIHRSYQKPERSLDVIIASAQRLGLTLPASFLHLMGSEELQNRIPSCTACYFSLSRDVVPCPATEDGYIVRFLNDQQGVLYWYLYLTPRGEQCVLVSPFELDDLSGDDTDDDADDQQSDTPSEPLNEQQLQAILQSTFVCAPSFAAFTYRFWLENTIWFKLNESGGQDQLTAIERLYLSHYAPA